LFSHVLLQQENRALCCVPITEKMGIVREISPLFSIAVVKG
jgi:hypothetical protein